MFFSIYLLKYTHEHAFRLIYSSLGFENYTSPDLANRGYYNLVSELWLTDSGKGTHVQRSVAQLGSSVGR